MELSDTVPTHRSGRQNKFKLSSFPDYVRRVQQISRHHSVSSDDGGQLPLQPTRGKKQNLSRALSCFKTSSNSPMLTRPPARPRATTLPPLHGTTMEGSGKNNNQSKIRPHCSNSSSSGDILPHSLHRASSFPQMDPKPAVIKADNVKSPYLQPLVHKPYYRKQAALTSPMTTKTSRKVQMRNKSDCRTRSHTIHDISDEKQTASPCVDKLPIATTLNELPVATTTSLTIPSITVRAATPSVSELELSTSLLDQFTARNQLAAELEKLNREVHNIVVCVEKV